MNRTLLAFPVAAALALALSACGRGEPEMMATNPELPRAADLPVTDYRPAAGTQLNPDTSDPSIPRDQAVTAPAN